jgi:hypothetical protein
MNSSLRRKLTLQVLAAALCTASGFSHAQKTTDYNKTILVVGVQETTHYIELVEKPSQNCIYDTIYISPEYKALYAQALSAKLADRKVSRIDYVQPNGSGTVCNAVLIEFAD